MNARDYPASWPALSKRIRTERAGGRCECRGECGKAHLADFGREGTSSDIGRCEAKSGDRLKRGEAKVVLTVAHLCRPEDHDPPAKCGDEAHLLALCQACHLRLDYPIHVQHARETRARRQGVQKLPGFAAEGEGGLCPEGRGLDPSRGRCDSVPPLVCRVPTEAEAADLARTEPEYVRPVRTPDA